MSTRTSQRRLAIKQRELLEDLGYPTSVIDAFADLFKAPADRDDRIVCAADKETSR